MAKLASKLYWFWWVATWLCKVNAFLIAFNSLVISKSLFIVIYWDTNTSLFIVCRGFSGTYVKEYVEASNPAFAIGEYWDSLAYEHGSLCYNQGNLLFSAVKIPKPSIVLYCTVYLLLYFAKGSLFVLLISWCWKWHEIHVSSV